MKPTDKGKYNAFLEEQPAVEAKRQVDYKYASHVPSCIQTTAKEAKAYNELLCQRTSDTIKKHIPTYNPNNLPGVSSMWGSALKLTEAANRHPDFWSEFKDLQNRFSVKTYSSQHEAYAQSIRSSKNLQQADVYASQLQDWHNSLTNGFHLDVNKMLQKFDSQLKSVCEPPVMMPDPEPIHPIGDHHANAQANQPNQANNDEVARLMQMIEDMRGQLQDQRNTNNDLRTANTDLRADKVEMRERLAQKDTVIAEQNNRLVEKDTVIAEQNNRLVEKDTVIAEVRAENNDLQAQLVEKDVTITELRIDKENLTQEVTNKDVTINGLNLAIEQEHLRYDELNERYVALLGDGD